MCAGKQSIGKVKICGSVSGKLKTWEKLEKALDFYFVGSWNKNKIITTNFISENRILSLY